MKVFWTALALLLALAVESGMTHVLPGYARVVDPFLLVVVYCGLVGGETHGMLAGMAAGWMQDVHFGGRILGLSGLSKVLVGFGVGMAGNRFQLTEPGPRFLVLLAAVVADALLVGRLAAAFDLGLLSLSPLGLLVRAAVNAVLGAFVYDILERRIRRPLRRD